MPITMTDQALVFAAKNGNTKCFEELYKRYYDKIYALARTTVKNDADAEDVLQTTFIKAWQSFKTLDDPAAFNTWLQRITLNECYSLLRRGKPTVSMDEEGEDGETMQLESDLLLPQQYAERSDLSARLRKIIGELSDVQRETVLLHYYEELSVDEIARTMDCSAGTVKSRLFLARKAIKTEIEEQERKSGEKFYGLALIPFAGIFIHLIKSTMIPQAQAMTLYGSVSHTLFGTPLPISAAPAPAQPSAPPRVSVPHAAQPAPIAKPVATGVSAVPTVTAGVSTAAKASIPLWTKLVAGVVGVALAATGGYFGVRELTKGGSGESMPAATEIAETTAPAPIERELTAVDPAALPEDLGVFLNNFNFGYFTPDGQKEYDCGAPNDRLISLIARNGSCVNVNLYPGSDVEVNWDSGDPLGRYETASYISFGEEYVIWIAENVFHVEPDEIEHMLNASLEADQTLYEYERNGHRRLCNLLVGIGGPGFDIVYKTVKTDGEKYYIIYDVYISGMQGQKEGTYYTEVSELTVNGNSYWTMHRHSSTLPNLNDIAIPTGYDDAYRAYIRELNEQYLPIFGVESYEHNRFVAIRDVYGDGTPELLYWTSQDGGYGNKKYLHILTCENGALKTLYRSTDDDYVMSYMLYQTEESKQLYLFDYQIVVDSGHTIVSSFEEIYGALEKNERVSYSASYNMDDPSNYHYDYSWRVNGADVTEETFAQACESLLGEVGTVVMRSELQDYEDRFSGYNNVSLTVDEALDRLHAALGMDRPTETDEEIFRRFAGDYTFTSGVGGWGTTMTINPDGSFRGTFVNDDYISGDGYEMTQLNSAFEGRFSHPKRINYYTYAFSIEELRYEHEPGTSEIKTLYGSTSALVTYTTAYGLDGSATVYAYTSDAYLYALPDAFLSWIKPLRYVDGWSNKLEYNCLFTKEGEQGWIGPKAE